MSNNGFAVVITLNWDQAEERIRLDYDAEGKCTAAKSTEYWVGREGMVEFNVRFSREMVEKERYSIELEYLKQDNADLDAATKRAVHWGKMRLAFSLKSGKAVLEKDDVQWIGDGENGPPNRARIRQEIPAELKTTAIKVRKQQWRFKRELVRLQKDASCAISGETMKALLDAAHIIAVADGGSDEVENGLLLRADIHRLFDAGIFEINLDGSLKMKHSGKLSKSYRDSFKAWSTQKISENVMRRIGNSLKKKKQMSKSSPEQVTV